MIGRGEGHGERGQTIILVAISIVALLAVAALAIDVVTLYVASSEIKRAADAAALAGAKGIADSGVTTLQASDPNISAAQTLAASMANAAITAILPVNTVAGSAPTCTNCPMTPNWNTQENYQGNPTVKVSLTQTNLPTFFARIWGRGRSTVSASSTAEVYNPSNNSSYTPIAPIVVKPWLVANADPLQGGQVFIFAGNVAENNAVGETFNLTADCNFANPLSCQLLTGFWGTSIPTNGSYPWVRYVPALITPNAGNNVCPYPSSPTSCSGSTPFEQSVECSDLATTYLCGANGASWNQSINPEAGGLTSPSAAGAQCLMHLPLGSSGLSTDQDALTYSPPFPNGPPQIMAGSYGPYGGSLVTTSNSIVTIPIVDPNSIAQNNPSVTVVGFMQAFINQVESNPGYLQDNGDINITVLNIAGCYGSANSNPPVVGGRGTSPVAVRLIASP